jgi:5-oxoprolinase (ATP-hydrolysing)
MANAIKKISVARGYDVTRYTLQCFGGAGGQHACLVADALGMQRVLVHPLAGVLSAYGMGLADQSVIREQAVECPLDTSAFPRVRSELLALADATRGELARAQGGAVRVQGRVHLRYAGSDSALAVPLALEEDATDAQAMAALQAGFEQAYRQRYAFLMQGRGLVVEAVSVEAVIAGESVDEPVQPLHPVREVPHREVVRMYSGGAWHAAALVVRDDLRCGDVLQGPCIIAERNATTVVEPGWQATLSARNHLVLERHTPRAQRHAAGTQVDPVLLEVFNNLFMNIAEQMGLQLQNTAHSVNIKERLDFSCALFDAQGHLIANAPHMPVHLGSMGESIQTVIRDNAGRMQPGDVYVLNDPYHGGTHLPDITVITPVYLAGAQAPQFYVGSRGHHADVGGTTPGSMPPFSRSIDEEGVQIQNFRLVAAGVLQESALQTLLGRAVPYPARNPAQNMADLRAQIAANEKGRAGAAPDGGPVRPGRRAGLHGPCAGQRRGVGAPGHPAAAGRAFRAAAGQRRPHRRRGARGCGRAQRRDRLHRHLAAADEQLQCAAGRLHGGRAVCVPHAGGRRHPSECRLSEAAARDRFRAAACSTRTRRRRSWPAMSRPPPASRMRCSVRWA